MANILDLSQFFVSKLGKVDEHRLHKLCYFAQGWSLAWTSKPITDAKFQAWKYGPVALDVRRSIDRTNDVTSVQGGDPTRLTDNEVKIAESVCEFYSPLSFNELTALSHGEAWEKARGPLPADAQCDTVLDELDLLKEFSRYAVNKQVPMPTLPILSRKESSLEDLLAAGERVEARWHEVFSLLAYR